VKSFACGDVVPGCDATWVCSTDDELLAEVARHAKLEHGLTEIPAELVDQVQRHIVNVG
jgi:predicted small metal-binding protein